MPSIKKWDACDGQRRGRGFGIGPYKSQDSKTVTRCDSSKTYPNMLNFG
jgi:hypothetical protein